MPVRQRISEARTLAIVFYRRAWIAVVARHASRVDDAAEVEVRGLIVAGAHRPIPATLGVPAHRKLNEAAVGGAMKERPRVIPGSDDIVRLELEHIGFFPAEAGLMASLIELSAPLNHRVVPVRRLVIHAIERVEFGAGDCGKCAGHARETVRAGDLIVARRADSRIGVGRRGRLCGRRRPLRLRLDRLRRAARDISASSDTAAAESRTSAHPFHVNRTLFSGAEV